MLILLDFTDVSVVLGFVNLIAQMTVWFVSRRKR